MNKKRVIGVAILAAVWLILGWLFLADLMKYRFLAIGDRRHFAVLAVCWVVIPVLLLAVKCFLLKKQVLQIIATVLFCVSLFNAFLAGVSLLLYGIPTYSYTENIENIGKYDGYVERAMKDADGAWFPDKLPEGAINVQYYYRYFNAAAANYFMLLTYQVEDVESLEQLRNEFAGYKTLYSGPDGVIYRWEKEDCGSIAETVINMTNSTVHFFFVRDFNKEELPSTVQETYAIDWREIIRLR